VSDFIRRLPLRCTHPKCHHFPLPSISSPCPDRPAPPSPSAHAARRCPIRRRESQWADTRPGRVGPSRGSPRLCVPMAAVCCILAAQRCLRVLSQTIHPNAPVFASSPSVVIEYSASNQSIMLLITSAAVGPFSLPYLNTVPIVVFFWFFFGFLFLSNIPRRIKSLF